MALAAALTNWGAHVHFEDNEPTPPPTGVRSFTAGASLVDDAAVRAASRWHATRSWDGTDELHVAVLGTSVCGAIGLASAEG